MAQSTTTRTTPPRILLITIRKVWYDKILRGDKREEYRDITDYWADRLEGRKYDLVKFRNGYAPHSPSFLIQYKGFRMGYPAKKVIARGEAPDDVMYIIKLGKIIKP